MESYKYFFFTHLTYMMVNTLFVFLFLHTKTRAVVRIQML